MNEEKKLFPESKWLYLLIAFIVAIGFWIYVQTTTDPVQTNWYNDVPVTLVGTSVLTSQGLTVGSVSQDQVSLYIQAPVSIHYDLLRNRSGIGVTLDVSHCTEGGNQLTFTPTWPSMVNTDHVYVENRDPVTINVDVEKLYTRTLNVRFQLQGKVADGYQVGTPAISPETVVISGPVEEVSQVSEVVAILNEENLKEQYSGDLPLTLLDSEGNVLTDLEVSLDSETAFVVLPIVVVREVDLTVNIIPGGGAKVDNARVNVNPSTILVSGPEEELENLQEISLGSVDLSRVIGSNTFTYPVNLDSSLENVSGFTEATVDVSIEGLSTRSFDVTNIQPIRVPEGFTATPITQVRNVTVRGDQEILDTLDASQIRIDVDMSQVSAEGTSSLPATVYLDADDSVGVVGEYYVSVSMTRS